MKLKVMLGILVITVSMLLTGCGKQEAGVVDVQRVMKESPQAQQFQSEIMASSKEMSEKLEQEKANLSQEEFQKRYQEVYGEFKQANQSKETAMREALDKAFAEVAKEKKLSVIMYKDNVAGGGVDVTDDVIKKLQ